MNYKKSLTKQSRKYSKKNRSNRKKRKYKKRKVRFSNKKKKTYKKHSGGASKPPGGGKLPSTTTEEPGWRHSNVKNIPKLVSLEPEFMNPEGLRRSKKTYKKYSGGAAQPYPDAKEDAAYKDLLKYINAIGKRKSKIN